MEGIYYALTSTRQSLFDFIDAFRWVSEPSYAGNDFLKGHGLRTAYISAKIGTLIGLPSNRLNKLIKAAMLHEVGFVFIKNRPDNLQSIEEIALVQHSEIGAWMVGKLSFIGDADDIAEIIRFHHVDYEQGMERDVPIEAFIVKLANNIDALQSRYDHPTLYREEMAEAIEGVRVPPEILDTGIELVLSAPYQFWFALKNSPEIQKRYLKNSGRWDEIVYDLQTLDEIGSTVLNLIDFRSPITSTHSTRVAFIAEYLSRLMDEPYYIQRLARIAGYLHDIGKVVIPIEILEKAGRLTSEEYSIIQSHICYTYLFFSKANIEPKVVNLASFHHERLDGSGYPFGLRDEHMSIPEKILQVADVAAALSEKRSYKSIMPKDSIISILKDQANSGKLCKRVVEVVEKNFDDMYDLIKAEVDRKSYEFISFVEEMASRVTEIEVLLKSKEISYSF